MLNPDYIDGLYPPEVFDLPVRELLERSQIDVTDDDRLGFLYAKTAYTRAANAHIQATDPTARGEAAAKAALRAERLEYDTKIVDEWISKSFNALSVDAGAPKTSSTERKLRERAATALLAGRIATAQTVRGRRDIAEGYVTARHHFNTANTILRNQHHLGWRWDRYATMADRHAASHEAVSTLGEPQRGLKLAVRGAWRALRADPEQQTAEEHRKFVSKQFRANAFAGIVAITKNAAARRQWTHARWQQAAERLVS